MADAVSIVASMISLIGVATDTNRRLIEIAQNISRGTDRTEFFELSNEVKSYAALLQAVQSLLEQRSLIPGLEALRPELDLAKGTFQSAQQMLHRYEEHLRPGGTGSAVRDGLKRLKWAQRKDDMNKIKSDLRARTTNLGLLLNVAQMTTRPDVHFEGSQTREANAQELEIIIAVLGPTGAGKSRFIQEVTGSPEVVVGNELTSVTETVKPHSITINGRVITLVDTPGFDDTFRGDAEILAEVAEWLAISYKSEQRLTGLVYMQPITMIRFTGTMLKNLRVFEKMVGLDNFCNVILVTSMWDQLSSMEEGISRERELCQGFWAPLIEKGSLTSRFFGNKSSASKTIGLMAFDKRISLKPPLAIQKEMVDERKGLDETAAGLELRQELSRMQRKYEEDIAMVRQNAQQDATTMRQELDAIRAEQTLLKDALTSKEERREIEARIRIDWNQRIKTLENPEAQIKIQDLRGAPPPYEEQVGRRTVNLWQRLLTVAMWARGEFCRAMRPRLQEGRTRLEWTCSCGDLLYGDFKAAAPGSLQKLAERLGAVILAGPATTGISSPTPGAPILPRPALLSGSIALSGQASGSGSAAGTGSSHSPVPQTGGATSASTPSTVKKKYLELCTKAADGFHRLGEIDVSSPHSIPLSDRVTFERIKAQYERDRTVVRMLGHFAVHRPKFGNFVQFRTDRRPLVAVERSGLPVPPADEVHNGRYLYNPVPMDEPPMPPRIFMHYLTKTTQAHTEAIWVTRFPHKLGDSIFYQSKPLTVGWGVEIEEVRNWRLFCASQLIALLSSGGLAALYATVQKDIASGIAIGGWLTAVQSLVVAMLFFRWA